jgi:hypothetical protein
VEERPFCPRCGSVRVVKPFKRRNIFLRKA